MPTGSITSARGHSGLRPRPSGPFCADHFVDSIRPRGASECPEPVGCQLAAVVVLLRLGLVALWRILPRKGDRAGLLGTQRNLQSRSKAGGADDILERAERKRRRASKRSTPACTRFAARPRTCLRRARRSRSCRYRREGVARLAHRRHRVPAEIRRRRSRGEDAQAQLKTTATTFAATYGRRVDDSRDARLR